MFLNLGRVIKFAWTDFSRNWSSNFVAIFVMVLVISLVSSLFIFHGTIQYLVEQVQARIDISVYFKPQTAEDDILAVKDELSDFSEVKEIQYISKQEALQKFIEQHKDNPTLMKALEEIGDNPFLGSLNIKTQNPAQYESVSQFLTRSDYNEIIEKIDYFQKKPVIEKLSSISFYTKRIGAGIAALLALIAVLVIFNSIKLAIYDAKEEISTMKMVGASNWFVRGPFIIQGALYGLLASVISLSLFALLTYLISPKLQLLLLDFNLFEYFLFNIWILVGVQLAFGVGLGVISSLVVIRKHLQV